MADRVIVQWDKNAVEDSGLIKLDLLGLRTLDLIGVGPYPADRGATRQIWTTSRWMIRCSIGDSTRRTRFGVFQVKTTRNNNCCLVWRHGNLRTSSCRCPLCGRGRLGGAVHPYLRRRSGEETVTLLLHPLLEGALANYGVLLYQEQVLRVAVDVAGFAPGEADLLRRALARSHSPEDLEPMCALFLRGAAQRGVSAEIAWRNL